MGLKEGLGAFLGPEAQSVRRGPRSSSSPRPNDDCLRVLGFGFRVWGLRFRVQGLGFGFRVQGLGCWV